VGSPFSFLVKSVSEGQWRRGVGGFGGLGVWGFGGWVEPPWEN